MVKINKSINIKGEVCPFTFVKSKLAIEQIGSGQVLEVILNNKEAIENIPRSMNDEGHKVLEVKKVNDTDWKILIKKK